MSLKQILETPMRFQKNLAPIVIRKLETLKKDIGFTARACWQAMKEIIKQTP